MTHEGHDPGGKVRLRLPSGTASHAVFDGPNSEFRYRLSRIWSPSNTRTLLFVMLNPSTADEAVDDPTVAKCGRLARRWGFGGLLVCNTFAYRATDQVELARVLDPIGPANDAWLMRSASAADLIVMAYGTPKVPALRQRGPIVARMLSGGGHPLHVLRLSKAGVPVHPLYLPESLTPKPWTPPL